MKLRNCIAALLVAAGALSLPASASIIHFTTLLSGANEIPPTASNGIGGAIITVDTTALTMDVHVTFSGLTIGNTAAHIHCCGTGNLPVATVTPTFTGFPTGATSGTYDHLFDMSLLTSWNQGTTGNPPPLLFQSGGNTTVAFNSLVAGMSTGSAYLNIHTSNFPGGEIRGILQVPEPESLALLGVALVGLAAARTRRSRGAA